MRYLTKIASKSFDDYFKNICNQFLILSINYVKNKLETGLKYKIYQAVWGLIKELKIDSQKLSQLPAIH